MAICLHQDDPVPGADLARATLPAGLAERVQARARAQALVRGRELCRQAVVHPSAICRTFSTFHPAVAWRAPAGRRHVPAVQASQVVRSQVQVAHLRAARPRSFCRTGQVHFQILEVVQARAALLRLYLHGREVALTLDDLDNQGAVGQVILAAPDNQAIGQAILAGRVDPVIGQPTLEDPADQVIGPAILVDQAALATVPVISAGRGNPGATLSRIFRAASVIARDGRTGVRSIVTTFATGGRTTPATSTIGSTTAGGTTTTSTGPTTLASDIGRGPRGQG
jgi:hypothetical protein